MALYKQDLERDEPGHEGPNIPYPFQPRPHVKNCYCPIDGHYCEQGDCDYCNFEKKGQ